MENVYEKIRNRRKELNMTQQELADKVGYGTKGTIAHIEKGDINIPYDRIEKFAHALDCSVDYLVSSKSTGEESYMICCEKALELDKATLKRLIAYYEKLIEMQEQ